MVSVVLLNMQKCMQALVRIKTKLQQNRLWCSCTCKGIFKAQFAQYEGLKLCNNYVLFFFFFFFSFKAFKALLSVIARSKDGYSDVYRYFVSTLLANLSR